MDKKILDYKKKFDNDGIIILRNFFPKKIMNFINRKLDSFIFKETKKIKNKKRFVNFVEGNVVNSFHKMDNMYLVKKIKKNKKLIKIIESLFSEKIVEMGSELFAKPSRKGLASPFHQDNFYFCLNNGKAVTVWIALEEANKKNGGVEYFIGSHRGKLLRHIPSYAPGSSQKVKNLKNLIKYKRKIPKLNKGDCMIHHSMIVHGSGINKSSKSRKGLTVRFKARSSKVDKLKQNVYWKFLDKQVEQRKRVSS
tara:strand:+ start:3092 stop:3847 length:756 start_codon:yes stop_codon:yes gene_type:complete